MGLDDIKLLEGIFLEQPKAPALENDPVSKGALNNYVDKMRGEGGQKCLFLSTLRV